MRGMRANRNTVMRWLPRLVVLFSLASAPLLAQRDIGPINVYAQNKTIPVRVHSDSPELNNLALQAFGAHGRYRLVASGYTYDIGFTSEGPGAVEVDVTRGGFAGYMSSGGAAGSTVLSQVVSGTD